MCWRVGFDAWAIFLLSNQGAETEIQVARAIGPAPPRRRLPLMTMGLILAQLLIAFAQWAASGYPLSLRALGNSYAEFVLGAKVPSLIAHGEYWRLVTANWLHADVLHLLVNMLGLLALGHLVELFYGRLRILIIYVLSGVLGAIVSYKFTAEVSLGASTGVMGLVGAVLLHNARYRRYLPPRVNAIYPVLLIVLAVQLIHDLLSGPRIDFAGHLGGLFGGGIVASLLESRIAGPRQSERDWLPLPTGVATAVLLLGYGVYGLLTTLPQRTDLLRAGRSADANLRIAALQRALAERPYFTEARLALVLELARRGELDRAKEALQEAFRQSPWVRDSLRGRELRTDLALAYYRRGMRAYDRGRWERALADSDSVLELDPTASSLMNAEEAKALRATSFNQSAWVLADKVEQDLPRAEKLAKQAVAMSPDEAAFIDTLAWVYYKQGRYQQALETQLRALNYLNNRPGNQAEYYYHLGAIYEKLGKRAEALSHYRRALTLQGRYPQAEEGVKRLAPEAIPTPATPTPPLLVPPRRDPVMERGLIRS